jgi:polysaccharide pyruvyl transferase WcaK-like protein
MVSAVMWCDIAVVGGGELVQDVSSLFYTPFNLLPLFLAFLFRKKSFAWAVGIGQMNELAPMTPFLIRLALWACEGITVRDRGSFNVLHSLGFREPSMILAADSALTLSSLTSGKENSDVLGAAPRNVFNRSGKLLPLEIRKKMKNYKEPDPLPAADAWAELLDAHIRRHGSEVILFPFHTGSLSNDDHEFCDLIMSRMIGASNVRIADPSNPEEFTGFISMCKVLVTTPLHGAILSVVNGTVPISVAYSSKCVRFMEQAELGEYAFSLEAGIPDREVAGALEEVWTNADGIMKRMIPVRDRLMQRALKTADYFRKTFSI